MGRVPDINDQMESVCLGFPRPGGDGPADVSQMAAWAVTCPRDQGVGLRLRLVDFRVNVTHS